jgi:dipeptidase D
MSKIIEHFETITAIPHCSEAADGLFDYLVAFASRHGYTVQTDATHNILASKGRPKLALQVHYDMVCMGKAPTIETYVEAGWMHARDASLGADNGIGIAMMMVLMEEGAELEFLFTADEEIGLIGASALALDIRASQMLNLDSEDEGDVTIGCAGGADITAVMEDTMLLGEGACYEVAVHGLPGGHSGVDIDRGIPSAIKVLAAYLYDHGVAQIATIVAGERRNAIPAHAVAIVRSVVPLEADEVVQVRLLDEAPEVYARSREIVETLHGFEHGVRTMNGTLGIPQTSINLALVYADGAGNVTIETSARAMSMKDLDVLVQETVSNFEKESFSVRIEDKYPAWTPEENDLTQTAAEAMKREFGHANIMAIHAGLECGILRQKFPHIQFASIGPTIRYPHSTRECVDLASVERTFEVVKKIIMG